MNTMFRIVAASLVGGAVAGAALGFWEARPGPAAIATNPLDADAATQPPAGGPRAEVPETVFAFGNMESGATQRHKFAVRNRGAAPLRVVYLTHTCKCTSVELDGKQSEPGDAIIVDPGDEITAELEWAAKIAGGPFRHGADFETNDPETSRFSLTVEGEVVASTTLSPSQVQLGVIRAGQPAEAEVLVMSFLESQVEVREVDVQDAELAKRLKVEVQPTEKSTLPDPHALAGVRLLATFDSHGSGVGPFGGSIRIKTNLAQAPTLEIPVYGSVKGDVSIFGLGWSDAAGVLKMPPMSSANGGQATLNLTLRGARAQQTQVAVESVDPPELKVTLGKLRPLGDNLAQQSLAVEVPPGTRPMVRAGENEGGDGLVVLSTDNPTMPTIRLRVSFTVTP